MSSLFVWIPLIGFDRGLPDKGVSLLLDRMSEAPAGVSVFLGHPDIVHHHNGIDNIRMLPPYNCSYHGSPRNEERSRQSWSNHDLKHLVGSLNDSGISPYLGIMGTSLDGAPKSDALHKEWISDYRELKSCIINKERQEVIRSTVNVLKRFKDGTYYEDFFADKICKVLTDYGFAGLHAADNFCPQVQCGISWSDYSSDMVKQFMEQTGAKLPVSLSGDIDSDGDGAIIRRRDWIWNNLRHEWIMFYTIRWEKFWRKICSRLHAIGKKVMVNNAWCCEPFEAIYRYGIDYRRLSDAGVDYMVPETVPNGLVLNDPTGSEEYRYYKFMTMSMFMSAYAPGLKHINLLGVKDTTEEWDVLHHAPTHLERDIYTLTSYYRLSGSEIHRCGEGLMVCLGDGIYKDEWAWLKERIAIGISELPEEILTPSVLWSDAALHGFLPDYIRTRRPSAHKLCYELNKRGGIMHAIAKTEHLQGLKGALFVPNLDLFTPDELKAVFEYKNAPVICVASAMNGFDAYSLNPDIVFTDERSEYRLCAFALNMPDVDRDILQSFLNETDSMPDIDGDPFYAPEPSRFRAELAFSKVSEGFLKACAYLIRACRPVIFAEKAFAMPMRLKDGRTRLYLINDDQMRYARARVTSKYPIKKVENISRFPVLPVKFRSGDGSIIINPGDAPEASRTFTGKVPPGGISIFDIYTEEEKTQ